MNEKRPRRRLDLDPFANVFLAAALFLAGVAMFSGDITIPQSSFGGILLMIAGLLVLAAVIVSWRRARQRHAERRASHEARRGESA